MLFIFIDLLFTVIQLSYNIIHHSNHTSQKFKFQRKEIQSATKKNHRKANQSPGFVPCNVYKSHLWKE